MSHANKLQPAPARIKTDVLIVGAGPTGLTLGAALAARGIDAILVDRQAQGSNTSRAAVVHARTLEVLEALDVSDTLCGKGIPAGRFTIRDRDRILVPITFANLPTRYPYALMVPQSATEQVLNERLMTLGGIIQRPRVLNDLVQDSSGATATFDDGGKILARYVIGADGMNSTVRQCAGIPFAGGSYGESFVLADAQLSGELPEDEVRLYFSPAGMAVIAPLPGGAHRIVATVDNAPEVPDLAYVQSLLDARGPKDRPAQVRKVIWGSRFRLHHRVAETFRRGRIVLAGDAAHTHSPAGGQGMNTGILDAMCLADLLDKALSGREEALDQYGAERRPVAREVVRLADRLTRLATVPPGLRSARNLLLAAASRFPAMRDRLAWRLSGLAYR
ncbi:MAG: FAD-dependent monooxygenase [Rhodocyclaceae bacterium]|nr:FAD-dependent monooxygenase [Rhodocyclaceae bacterium]